MRSCLRAAEPVLQELSAPSRAAAGLEQLHQFQEAALVLQGAESGPLTGNSRRICGVFFAVKLRWKQTALISLHLRGVARIYSCRAPLVSLGLKGILIQSEGKQAGKRGSKQRPLHLSSASSHHRASFSSQ